MNQDQIYGILRVIVPVICTALAAHGLSAFSDTTIVADVTAAVVAVAAAVWSFLAHTASAKIAAAARVDPGVDIKIPPKLIVDNTKVATLVADPTIPNVTAKAA